MRLRRVQPVLLAIVTAGVAGRAWGQAQNITGPEVTIGYQGLPSRSPRAGETGLQLNEDLLLHAGIGAESGYDSNVFYSDTNVKASPMVRVLPYVELTNATRAGAVPGGTYFDLSAGLIYREYLSNDQTIRNQRAIMPSASGSLELSANQTVGFSIADSFIRLEDPPYFGGNGQIPNNEIYRDSNQAAARVRWSPGGGRLSTTLAYMNTIDIFEVPGGAGSETDRALSAANSMTHQLLLDAAWKWLPKTALFLSLQQGYVSYFNPGKNSSYPLHAMAGLRGLITEKLTATVAAGYANGFYKVVSGPSGLRGYLSATADVIYRPTVLTTIGTGYRHDFQNAVLGDFYYLDAVYLNVGQAIAGRFGLGLSGRYESRSYSGIPVVAAAGGTAGSASRHDNFWQIGGNLDYHIRAWTYVGVAYTLMANLSDWQQGPNLNNPPSPDYVKQLFFARLGITY